MAGEKLLSRPGRFANPDPLSLLDNFHLTVGTGDTVEIIDPPVAANTVHSANVGLFG
jgi:hypothetical protein